jgi:hypothetical protein
MHGNNQGSLASSHKSGGVVSVLASGTSTSPKNARSLTPRCEGLNAVSQVTLTTIEWPACGCYFCYWLISYLKKAVIAKTKDYFSCDHSGKAHYFLHSHLQMLKRTTYSITMHNFKEHGVK